MGKLLAFHRLLAFRVTHEITKVIYLTLDVSTVMELYKKRKGTTTM